MKLSRPLILLSLAAVLPLVVLAAVLGGWILLQQQAALQREAEAQVRLASTVIDRLLTEQVAVLTTVAAAPVVMRADDTAALKSYLDRVRGGRLAWRSLSLSDPGGRRIAFSSRDATYPAQVVDRASLDRAVASREPVIGSILRGRRGFAAFAVRVPVIDGGRVVSVVSAVIEPEQIHALFAAQGLPAGWRGGVVDGTGRIVARLNASQTAIGAMAPPETLEARKRAPSAFAEATSIEGEAMVNAYQVLPRWGWSVHAAMPRATYQAPLIRSLWLAAVCAVIGLSLAAAFLWLLVRELRRNQHEGAALAEMRRMEALGRMTGGVAHDFNNILMIVQGSAELMKRRPDRAEALIEGVLTAAQRGHALTRQLLAFARRGAQERLDFRLQDRAGSLSELVRQSLRPDIAVEISIPPEVWPIHADPEALEIALINLAVNARDAMPGGGAFRLSAANVVLKPHRGGEPDLEGAYVAISVRDSGDGVPEQHLRHIFEPFYTTKPVGRGTGLGLSQVYGFARQSGGAVTVASAPGEGAVFTLYLPRAEAAASVAAVEAPASSAPSDAGRLLLVEDDPEVGLTVEAMLTHTGYQVVRVADVDAALEVLDADGVDVVLSDVMLGGPQSGLDLARRLRRDRPDLPVVLMTAYAERLEELGAEQAVLTKPFGPDALIAVLRRARAWKDRAA